MKAYSFRKDFIDGFKAAIPIMLGYVAVSVAYAVMAGQAGLSVLETTAMSAMVYAGASQMMAVGMISQGSDFLAIITATFVINFRHFIMTASVMERVHHSAFWTNLLFSFGVTDESFVVFTTTPREKCTGAYMAGLFTTAFFTWVLGSLAGALASNFLPALVAVSSDIALHAMFISLIVPNIRGNYRLGVLVLATGLINSLLSQFISANWALVISALLTAAVGVFYIDSLDETEGEEGNEN